MLHVSNQSCIRDLSRKSFRASRTRNVIAILAIALTTILFTALFTVGLSMNEAFQQSNFRQVGGFCHGGFKYLSQDEFNQLKNDPLIKEWSLSRVLGMAQNDALRKNHVEVRYCDATDAHWMFLDPIEGRLPKEGTNEAATDLEILHLLGVEPKLGAEFTVLVNVNGQPTEQTFTLCGWWEKDPIVMANEILIPESRVNSVLKNLNITLPTVDRLTGSWNLSVMFKNAHHIEKDLNTILERHGYQSQDSNAEHYVDIGVNWGYTGAQFSDSANAATILSVLALLLLIVLTGYLIIYNVFQISVVNDIRFYGLLKTIGTTGRQIKAILRRQALRLCLVGIPIGCLLGWLIGTQLSPLIMSHLNGFVVDTVSVSPLIFIGSGLFALLTVLLSCARPGRLAAKVSPVEAIRCADHSNSKKAHKKSRGLSILQMAVSNLGRNKGKTLVTILSLALALVLLQMTTLFTNGFDMDKYLQDKSACDFILADGAYFNNNVNTWRVGKGMVDESVIADITSQPGITDGGRVYGQMHAIQQFAPEEWVRKEMLHWGNSEEVIQYRLANQVRTPDGRVMDQAQTYGMEPFLLDKLTVLEGDLSGLYQPGSHAIAAVYNLDDYGNLIPESHWAKLGDTITLRVPDKWEYYNPETGEIHDNYEAFGDQSFMSRPSVYRDETFTVEALVVMPNTLSYRYSGSDEFILNSDTFQQMTQKSDIMLYAFDVEDDAEAALENFLHQYTQQQNPRYGYESRQSYVDEFNSFRSMFLIIGSLLSFIVGLVGVLNFINAILTGILTRKQELAMLQSIGMTGKQLKHMLMCEGLLYALGAALCAFAVSLIMSPVAASALSSMLWFFSYHPPFAPLLIVTPIFVLLGLTVPLLVYRRIARQTIVERLRQAEN